MDIRWLKAADHYSRKEQRQTSEKAWWVRGLGTKPSDVSLNPRTHKVEREKWPPQAVL